MAHPNYVRSLFDVLQERQRDDRDAAEVRAQAQAFRSTGRLGTLAGLAGQLFPLGQQYERARMEDPGLRPFFFAQQQREEPMAALGLTEEQRSLTGGRDLSQQDRRDLAGRSPLALFTSDDLARLALQQEALIRLQSPGLPQGTVSGLALEMAYSQLSPQTQQELVADEEATLTRMAEFRRTEATLGNLGRNLLGAGEAIVGAGPRTGNVLADLAFGRPGEAGQEAAGLLPLIESVVPEQAFGPIEDFPAVGPSLADSLRFGTSPVGAATAAIPATRPFFLAGEAGAVGAGTLAESLGAPTGVRIGAEVAGGILAPGAGLVNLPGRLRPRGAVLPGAAEIDEIARLTGREPFSAADLIPTQAAVPPAPVVREAAGAGAGDVPTIDRALSNIQLFDRNMQEVRRFVRDSLEPAFLERFGDAPVMNVQGLKFPSGGEALIEIRTGGWRKRAEELGLEFVREKGHGDLYRLPPTARIGEAPALLPERAPVRAVEPPPGRTGGTAQRAVPEVAQAPPGTSLRGAPTGEVPFGEQRPLADFGPEEIRPPAGREAPLFPQLEERAALEADIEKAFGDVPELARAETVAQRDFVGEELLRRSHPTQTDVERWSGRTPPEVRAEAAGDVADVRRPVEDIADVATREGKKYQSNWFTKLDDYIQPLLGKDRALQKVVRNLWVTHDSYITRQGARMRHATLEWIGTHKETLGLVTAGRQRGYARAIPVRPGAKIPRGLEQNLDHITEHSEKYVLTQAQSAALAERQRMFTQMARTEQRNGIDTVELVGNYAPRIITKTPKGESLTVAVTKWKTRYPKTHPWFTKNRAIPDIEGLWAAGYKTADPLTAMQMRLEAGVEAIGNNYVVREIKGLGFRPAEKISPQLADTLRAAQVDHQAARRLALRSGSTEDRALADAAAAKLDQAKSTMRQEADLLRQRSPQEFGRVVAPEVKQELARYIEQVPEGEIDDFFRVLRTMAVNADYGSLFLQNYTTFWRNNPAWLKAVAWGARSWSEAPYDYIVRNADAIDVALKYGHAHAPEEFLLHRGGRVAQWLGRQPVIRESQRIFEWNVFIAQVERSKGVARLANTPDELLELGSVLRKQSGSNFMPGLTRAQAATMSRLWFAPQFTAAIQGMLLDPLVKTGVARREAMRTLGMVFGGAASMTVALNLKLTGELPNMNDPDKPGFWGVRTSEDGYDFPMGPFQPLIVALARSGRVATDLAQGKKPRSRDLQAWPNFIANKASIPARFVLRIGEVMGLPFEEIRGPAFGRQEFKGEDESATQALKRGLFEAAPIGPKQAFEGIRAGAPITAGEIFGRRTSVVSPFQKEDEAVQADAAAGLFQGTYPSGPPTERGQLTRQDKAAFDTRHADLRAEIEGRSADFAPDDTSRFFDQSETSNQLLDRGLEDISQQVRSGQFGDLSDQQARREVWDGVKNLETQRVGRILLLQETFPDVIAGFDREPFSREAALINRYFELQERHRNRNTDEQWAAYEADLQRTFNPADLDTIQRELGVGNHDLQNAWDFLNAQLEGYYDVPEGRSQARQRTRLRRQNSQMDASLYLLGRVGCVQTREARRLAESGSQSIWGQQVEADLCGSARRGPSGPQGVR